MLTPTDALRNFAAAAELAMLETLAADAAASERRRQQDFADSPELARMNDLIAESRSRPDEQDWFAIIGESERESVHSNFLSLLKQVWVEAGAVRCLHSTGTAWR